jgi:hypothetical protein
VPNPSGTLLPSATTLPEQGIDPPVAARWTFVAADRDGNEIAEVRGATQRTVTPRPLNGLGTASLRLRANHLLAPFFAQGETARLKVYEETRDHVRTLRFVGMVTSYEEVHAGGGGAQEDGVVIGFTHPALLLSKRMVGKSRTGYSKGTALAPVDAGQIMLDALQTANNESATEIIAGTSSSSTLTYVSALLFKPLLELNDELSGVLGGYDYQFESIDPLKNAGATGKLNIAAAIGQLRPSAIWEYGTGRANVKTWRRVIDPKAVANKAWHIPTGYPDNTSGDAISRSNTGSIASRGLQEVLVSSDITPVDWRAALCQEHVDVRNLPRQIITFEPRMEIAGDLRYRDDYAEGDIFTFHAMQQYPAYDQSGVVTTSTQNFDLVDALMRMRAVTFNVTETGDATTVFILTSEDTLA